MSDTGRVVTHDDCGPACSEVIDEPGKFEGEPVWVRDVIWPMVMEGMADNTIYGPAATDVLRPPFTCDALRDLAGVAVWEDEAGFIHHITFATPELLDAFERDAEREATEYNGPQEDDLTTEDGAHYFQGGKPAFTIEEHTALFYKVTDAKTEQPLGEPDHLYGYFTFDTQNAAVKAWMDKQQFWPNVWTVSDHGNAHLMDLSDEARS